MPPFDPFRPASASDTGSPSRPISRKSSIAPSRAGRAPASLRLPSAGRKTSNAQLSRIFAMGDSSLPPSAADGTGGQSDVEQALSRQLDGDLGGKQMGLRSRRSSSATVRTVRTTSGLRSPSSDHTSFMEEDEGVGGTASKAGGGSASNGNRERITESPEPIAGPSSQPLPVSATVPNHPLMNPTSSQSRKNSRNTSPERTPVGKRSLNPKNSSSWLRWTSPAPSFPRSPSAGRSLAEGKPKGKGKEHAEQGDGGDENLDVAAGESLEGYNVPGQETCSPQPVPHADRPASPHLNRPPASTHYGTPLLKPPDQVPSTTQDQHSVPAPSPAKGRGWFGRSTLAQPSHQQPKIGDQPAPAAQFIEPQPHVPAATSTTTTADFPSPALTASQGKSNPKDSTSSSNAAVQGASTKASSQKTKSTAPSVRTTENLSRKPSRTDPLAGPRQDTVTGKRQDKGKDTQGTITQRSWRGYLGWGGGVEGTPREKGEASLAPNGSEENTNTDRPIEDGQPENMVQVDRTPAEIRDSPELPSTSTTAAVSDLPNPPSRTSTEEQTVGQSQGPQIEPQGRGKPLTQAQVQPWSSYLYSFIVPEIKPRPSSSAHSANLDSHGHSPGHIVEPTDPTEDQRPVHLEPPTEIASLKPDQLDAASVPTGSTSIPAPEQARSDSESQYTTPNQSVSPAREPTRPANANPTSDRRPSTSAAGWLNYLAFRASQKKMAPASVDTAETGHVSGEEVMDFSNDPEFPTSTSTPTTDAAGANTTGPAQGQSANLAPGGINSKGPRDVRVTSESLKSVTPKPSQNLNVKKKRLSTSSSIVSNATGGMSVSPRPRSSLDSTHGPSQVTSTTKAPSTSGGVPGSSLPPPPSAPAVQPNLVIPTFETTFDRPPRSFLPLPPPAPPADPPAPGITASTTTLAWKALGAVGSYVYGSGEHKLPESMVEDENEQRGRKEGRTVGSDLPRRVGLGNGHPDDGWKNVRRVVVVGVHGWFPAKMLNSVIGEPTGTSVKFANMMAQAVKQFFVEKGVKTDEELRLTLMPLEGEGTIESRVDRLYKAYLSNPAWINDLRRADAIFFAAHSQGCIVTTHLISRMIAQGHIRTRLNAEAVSRCEWAFGPIGVIPDDPRRRRGLVGLRGSSFHSSVQGSEGGYQKVAMLAMCGVHLGPLHSISTSTVIQPYLQWFENAAARELFEFQDTTSAVSVAYQKALSMVLENEVRVVLLASLNDQVVPIYGASFSAASHPLLLRALYVDGASYTQSDFMTNLLCFAFMLRNAGIDDQRLVEHLSEATAGSLTGLGHSTPYEELSSYSLAVHYLFHSGPVPAGYPIPALEVEPFSARETRNDFELPWIMRALVDSPQVKDLFPGELRDLKESILAWRPTTKALREIKRRLEPMAGRQSRLRAIQPSPSTSSLASAHEQAAAAAGLGVSPGANKLSSGKTAPFYAKSRL